MSLTPRILLAALAVVLLHAGPASAVQAYWADFDGFPGALDGDILVYDTVARTNNLAVAEGSIFQGNEAIDALHLTSEGHFILSTTTNATINGSNQSVSFQDEDLVRFDPVTGEVFLYENMTAHFQNNEDVDAFSLLDDGSFLLSTTGNARINGSNQSLSFQDEDIVRFDPTTGEVNLFLDMTPLFVGQADVASVHMHQNGMLYFTTNDDETIGTTSFRNDHIVVYDMGTNTMAGLFDTFVALPGFQEIRALYMAVPEPSLALAMGLSGLLVLGARRRE